MSSPKNPDVLSGKDLAYESNKTETCRNPLIFHPKQPIKRTPPRSFAPPRRPPAPPRSPPRCPGRAAPERCRTSDSASERRGARPSAPPTGGFCSWSALFGCAREGKGFSPGSSPPPPPRKKTKMERNTSPRSKQGVYHVYPLYSGYILAEYPTHTLQKELGLRSNMLPLSGKGIRDLGPARKCDFDLDTQS